MPLASVIKAVAGIVIIAVAAVFVVPLAPVLVLFSPLPVAYVTVRHGWVFGMIVAVVAAGLLYAGMGSGVGLLTFLFVGSTGVTLGWSLRKGWPISRSLAVIAGSLLVALVVYGLILWLGFGVGLTELKKESLSSISDTEALFRQVGFSAATADSLSSYAGKVTDAFQYLAPGFLAMTAILMGSAIMGLAYLIFPRLRRPQAVHMSLSTFRLHWGLAYVSIVGLAMLLFARGGAGWHAVLFYMGLNLLMVSQTLFFLQALGVLRWLGNTRQWRTGARTFMFIVAVLAQALIQLTGLVGLLDTWIDYRKRFALKGSGPGSVR